MRWLVSAPRCWTEGQRVQVVFELTSGEATAGAHIVRWNALDRESFGERTDGTGVSCSIPARVFRLHAPVKLTIMPAYASGDVVFPWTKIPILGEVLCQAGLIDGRPVLEPLEETFAKAS